MSRPRINAEAIPGRFPSGTKKRLATVRKPKESQAAQLRAAVLLLLKKRERTNRHNVSK